MKAEPIIAPLLNFLAASKADELLIPNLLIEVFLSSC